MEIIRLHKDGLKSKRNLTVFGCVFLLATFSVAVTACNKRPSGRVSHLKIDGTVKPDSSSSKVLAVTWVSGDYVGNLQGSFLSLDGELGEKIVFTDRSRAKDGFMTVVMRRDSREVTFVVNWIIWNPHSAVHVDFIVDNVLESIILSDSGSREVTVRSE